jgi:hypothetical protein
MSNTNVQRKSGMKKLKDSLFEELVDAYNNDGNLSNDTTLLLKEIIDKNKY